MKKRTLFRAVLPVMLACFGLSYCGEDVKVTAPDSSAASGLALEAVGQLFKDAANLEAFEKALNDPDTGVNNLDLNGDGNVNFIRVIEETAEGVHLIVLQAQLAENDFQDVATVEVEKSGGEQVAMQVHGNADLYGPDVYVTVTDVHIHRWPIIALIYGPAYRPYRSVFHFGFYPPWWRPFRPVAFHVYRTRTVRIVPRGVFAVTKTTRVHHITRVHYVPRSSVVVKTRVRVVRPAHPRAGHRR
jgi:hypothetical protein